MAGIILLTVGALNALFALAVGTCTMGESNLSGGWLTLIFYVAGLAALISAPPSRAQFLALAPAAIIAACHSWFALIFSYGYWFRNMSACFALQGGFTPEDAGEWMDGGEPLLSILWCGLSLLFWIGMARAFKAAGD